MSKSKGNVVDPKVLVDRYGSDALRYFLLREIAFGQDGNFNNEALIQRINSDLANDFGNLLSRTIAMIQKYFNGQLPEEKAATAFDQDLKNTAKETIIKMEEAMEKLLFSDSLAEIWNLIRRANKYIDETQPWVLAKDESNKAQLAGVLYNLAEVLRIVSILIQPFMPATTPKVWNQLGISEGEFTTWDSIKEWGKLPDNIKVNKGEILFPRIDLEDELKKLEEALKKAQEEMVVKAEEKNTEQYISIDDFSKVELKVGEVIECEKVENADKLLKSKIKIGDEGDQKEDVGG